VKNQKKSKKSKTLRPSRIWQPQISVTDAARHCHVSPPTLKEWVRAGWLRAFKTPGGHHRILLEDFQAFLRAHDIPPYTAGEEARVLLVDDQVDVLEPLHTYLTASAGRFKVETALDGHEALIKIGSFAPAVLVLDVVMPGLDGVAVCRRLKADPTTRDIKVIAVTGHPDRMDDVMAAGADNCLSKPLSPADLEREVNRLLGRATDMS
jgi:excisionase family DNA binding protein